MVYYKSFKAHGNFTFSAKAELIHFLTGNFHMLHHLANALIASPSVQNTAYEYNNVRICCTFLELLRFYCLELQPNYPYMA